MKSNQNIDKFLVSRPLFAKFNSDKYGIPIMWKSNLDIKVASYANILNSNHLSSNINKSNYIISSFAYNKQLNIRWNHPFKYLKELRKCLCVLTPDFSASPGMNESSVIYNTYKNRWMGCFYQQYGINVIPTISWAEPWTYDICKLGLLKNNPYAISSIGVTDINMFLDGYRFFKNYINPPYIILYGKVIAGMTGNIIGFSYKDAFAPNKHYEQLSFSELSSRLNIIEEEK